MLMFGHVNDFKCLFILFSIQAKIVFYFFSIVCFDYKIEDV